MRGATAPRLILELICGRMLLPGGDNSEAGLLSRIERLERDGAIQGYTVRINPAQLDKLALKTNSPVDMLMRGDGDFVNGMDFVLRKKP